MTTHRPKPEQAEKKEQIKYFNKDSVKTEISRLEGILKTLETSRPNATQKIKDLYTELEGWEELHKLFKLNEIDQVQAINFLLFGFGYDRNEIRQITNFIDRSPAVILNDLSHDQYGKDFNLSNKKTTSH